MSNKGRTLWEILTGRNKRDLTPLELQYHNPLGAKCGCAVIIEDDEKTSGVNFFMEKMSVYETRVGKKSFYHTDYYLKGVSLDKERPIRLILRLIPDEDILNEIGSKVLLMSIYDERGFESTQEEIDGQFYGDSEFGEFFVNEILSNSEGILDVNQDEKGNELTEPLRYWRVEDVLDPYHARVTTLKDEDGNGKVEDNELHRNDVSYWDYYRQTKDIIGNDCIEYLTVEMDDKSRYFTFFRGKEISADQITVF